MEVNMQPGRQQAQFWNFVLPAIATVAAGLIGKSGQDRANETNMMLSEENRKWQEAMSGSAYQRAVLDMQKAGLSPMLAYSQGGASTPQGSVARVENAAGAGIASAAQGMSMVSGIQQMAQSAEQTKLLAAQTERTIAETQSKEVYTARAAAELAERQAAAKEKGVSADVAARTQYATETGRVAESVLKQLAADAARDTWSADVARRKAESQIMQFGVAEAKAGSQFYEKMEDAPAFVKMIVELLRGTSTARGLIGR